MNEYEENELKTIQIDDKVLVDVLKSAINEYREIYYVNLKMGSYQMLYPSFHNENEIGDYNKAIERHFADEIIYGKDKEEIRRFLKIDNIIRELSKKDVIECKYKRRKDDGSYEWCLTSFTACHREKDKTLISVIMTIRSIDELVRMEEEQHAGLRRALRDAEALNASKVMFVSKVAHDVRTPMNTILGFTELAKESMDDKEELAYYLDKIHASAQNLIEIMNDVLVVTNAERGTIGFNNKPYDIVEIIKRVEVWFVPMTKAKDIQMTVDYALVEHTRVICDQIRMMQIFSNILNNALKFTPSGGEVYFGAKEVSCTKKEVGMEFTIKDNGAGMSEDFVKEIYKLFARERVDGREDVAGMGIGMPIVKDIVDQMGGEIHLMTKQNEGTTFVINLTFERENAGIM